MPNGRAPGRTPRPPARSLPSAASSQTRPCGKGGTTGSWQLDLTRLEDNRQALNERLRNHDLGGKLRLCFRSPARKGSQLLSRSHPLVVELAARASVIRTNAVTKRTPVLVLRLRHQLHQSRRNASPSGSALMVWRPWMGLQRWSCWRHRPTATSIRASASSGSRRRSPSWMDCNRRWQPWLSGVPI
jgi:hypothetical protein